MNPPRTKQIIWTVIWASALSLNLFLLALNYQGPEPRQFVGDELGYILQAQTIASGEMAGKGILWPTGYGYFLAAFIYAADLLHFPQTTLLLLAQIAQIILWIISGLLFASILSGMISSQGTRQLATGLFLLFPTQTAFTHYFWPEIPHLTFFLFAIWIIIKKPSSWKWNTALGISLAAMVLMKLVYLPLALPLCCIPLVRRIRNTERIIPALITPLIFAVMLLPAASMNYRMHGEFVVADSTVINAWIGLKDTDRTDWSPNSICGPEIREYWESAPTHAERNERYLERIKRLVREQGIIPTLSAQIGKQYHRLFDHRTFFTKQLPGGMMERYTFENQFIAKSFRILNDSIWGAILFGLGIGIVATLSKFKSLSWIHFFVLLIGYNLLLFLILHVKTRYVIAFFPMLCVISAAGWETIVHRVTKCNGHASWRILIAGLIVSLIFLHWAFSGT